MKFHEGQPVIIKDSAPSYRLYLAQVIGLSDQKGLVTVELVGYSEKGWFDINPVHLWTLDDASRMVTFDQESIVVPPEAGYRYPVRQVWQLVIACHLQGFTVLHEGAASTGKLGAVVPHSSVQNIRLLTNYYWDEKGRIIRIFIPGERGNFSSTGESYRYKYDSEGRVTCETHTWHNGDGTTQVTKEYLFEYSPDEPDERFNMYIQEDRTQKPIFVPWQERV